MMRRMLLCLLLVPAVFVWLGCRAVENSLVYHPDRTKAVPGPANAPYKDVMLRSENNARIHARWLPVRNSDGAILLCHGNAGNLENRGKLVHDLAKATGLSVLIFDYPGYGRSEGRPTEAGCYAAADSAYRWLTQTKKIAPTKVVVFGQSLGGGVAVDLASRRPHQALVLVRTFTSLPDVAQKVVPLASTRTLMSNRFNNLKKIGRCQQPVFIAHGDNDRLIPFEHGIQLERACPGKVQRYVLKGAGHNDPLPSDFYAQLNRFLQE